MCRKNVGNHFTIKFVCFLISVGIKLVERPLAVTLSIIDFSQRSRRSIPVPAGPIYPLHFLAPDLQGDMLRLEF